MQPDAINLFEISITGTACRRNMVFGVVWVSVAVAVARKRSAGAAAWTAKVLRHRLRHSSFAFPRLPACPLALPLAHFYSLQEKRAKKGYNKWVQVYLAGKG